MNRLSQPRTLDYFLLRTCERLGLTEREFHAADYQDQLRWLAFDAVRRAEGQEPRVESQRESNMRG